MKSSETKYTVSNNSSTWGLLSSGTLCSADGQLGNTISEQLIGPIFKGQVVQAGFGLPDPWRVDWLAVPKCRQLTENLRYITSQKSKDLIYTMGEAWNHAIIVHAILHYYELSGQH